MNNYIEYTIKATDSVKGIAKRFGVELNELVKLNPQVCTPLPQMGIVLRIPVDHLEVLPVNNVGTIEKYMVKLPDKSVYKVDKVLNDVSQFATQTATQSNK